ncbi:MAG: hypothetical protein EX285_03275 [Thaumarchaeota archaeon]|nr:hypothetical protein [Nitrososphaerota archaeon]
MTPFENDTCRSLFKAELGKADQYAGGEDIELMTNLMKELEAKNTPFEQAKEETLKLAKSRIAAKA